jgi:hypothetical protein
MTFADAINRLEKHIKVVHSAIIATAIIEAVLVILIGLASGNVHTNNSTINEVSITLLILFGLFYLFLLFIKTWYNQTFPSSITNELKYERENYELMRDAERQKTVNDFLVDVVQRLNGQTCALNYGDDTHLCDKGIKDGIYNLLQPVVDNIYFILDTVNTQFTVGVYLDNYRSLGAPNKWEHGLIVVDDDLNKSCLLQKDLLEINTAREEQFHIQTAIRQAFNNTEFVKQDYKVEAEGFSVVCSPILFACNEMDTNGVLFIITKQLDAIPSDSEVNLKIFNSVIANWVYRYNDCVNSRQEKLEAQFRNDQRI